MDLTTFFIVPNAHHRFGCRSVFSDFPVPSGLSFGGRWSFFCVLGRPWRALAEATIASHFQFISVCTLSVF